MKTNFSRFATKMFLSLLCSVLVFQVHVSRADDLLPERQHPVVSKVVARLFSYHHYRQMAIDDSVSSHLLDYYIEALDPNRSFFLSSDIASFKKYRYQFDEAVTSGQLLPAYDIYNTFIKRVDERIAYVLNPANQKFDFTLDESYEPARDKAPWPKTVVELNEIWRKRLKNEALGLKLAGKNDEGVVSTITNRWTNFQKRVKQNTSEDVFQIFMNGFSETFDPHTNYMSPIASENFGIQMSLSLQGIGAQLVTEGEHTMVYRIIPGGPADRSRELWANDKIVGVGQGVDGKMVDVVGMRLDDVVQMIRGEKGTTVRLEIIPAEATAGSPPKKLTLVRDKIVLTDREAKSDTLEITHDGHTYRIGVVSLPTFYSDMAAQARDDKNYKSTTRDVRQKIEELKKAGIDGLIIDLRYNSGGALQEAVELTGLFIDNGPVVQVRNSDGSVKVLKDHDNDVAYDGPLAVLVNRRSASASEIFAAAIQDYDRGLVLGDQTFGKGTVQQLISLDRYIPTAEAKLGQIKLTTAKFYRIAGGTTQHKGVLPDIQFPPDPGDSEIGESAERNALPWDQIQPTGFTRWNLVSQFLPQLRTKSQQRTAKNPEFRFREEDLTRYQRERAKTAISLQESRRLKEREATEEENLMIENKRRAIRGLPPLKKGEKAPTIENAPDPLLEESGHIVCDLLLLSKPQYRGKVVEQ